MTRPLSPVAPGTESGTRSAQAEGTSEKHASAIDVDTTDLKQELVTEDEDVYPLSTARFVVILM